MIYKENTINTMAKTAERARFLCDDLALFVCSCPSAINVIAQTMFDKCSDIGFYVASAYKTAKDLYDTNLDSMTSIDQLRSKMNTHTTKYDPSTITNLVDKLLYYLDMMITAMDSQIGINHARYKGDIEKLRSSAETLKRLLTEIYKMSASDFDAFVQTL